MFEKEKCLQCHDANSLYGKNHGEFKAIYEVLAGKPRFVKSTAVSHSLVSLSGYIITVLDTFT